MVDKGGSPMKHLFDGSCYTPPENNKSNKWEANSSKIITQVIKKWESNSRK